MISFVVDGVPASQGSKMPWGQEADRKLPGWRESIAWAAKEAMNGTEPYDGPVKVSAKFFFPRLKSHYGTGSRSSILKPTAPICKATPPDVDKLSRAVLDAIQGIVVRNDGQVALLNAEKWYGSPRVEVNVQRLELDVGDQAARRSA